MVISCCEMADFPHRKNSKHSKIDIKVTRMVVCTSSLHKKYFTQIGNRTANNLLYIYTHCITKPFMAISSHVRGNEANSLATLLGVIFKNVQTKLSNNKIIINKIIIIIHNNIRLDVYQNLTMMHNA